jgi:transposase InsO family protein
MPSSNHRYPSTSRTLDHYTAARRPWQEVAVDFVGSLPSGELLLVVIDEFSRFPKVEIVTTTSAKAVIPKLDNIFSRQGFPVVLKSDNSSPINSSEFEQFASYLGFEHRKVTPYWPKANGEVERFMRTIEKATYSTHREGELETSIVSISPPVQSHTAQHDECVTIRGLNNRKLKIPLPSIQKTVLPKSNAKARSRKERKDEEILRSSTTLENN